MAEKLLIYSHTQIFTLYLYSVMDWQLKILVYDTTFTYQNLFLLCRRGKEEEKERKKKEKYEQKKKDKIYCKLKFNPNTYFVWIYNIQRRAISIWSQKYFTTYSEDEPYRVYI